MYRESASNVRIGLKCTENRPQMYCASNVQRIGPQMYELASNVQRIGLKCTDQQISNFWPLIYLSIYLSDVSIYLSALLKSISVHLRLICTFEADSLYIWGWFSYVHLRPIRLYRTSPGQGHPILGPVSLISWLIALPCPGLKCTDQPRESDRPWNQRDWPEDRTPSPGRVQSTSNVVHLRPILCTFEASNVQLSDWLRQTLPLSDWLRQITWEHKLYLPQMYRSASNVLRIGLKCIENQPQMYGIGLKCMNWPQMYSSLIGSEYIWGQFSIHLRLIFNENVQFSNFRQQ